jgi:hypothetical protein
MKSWEQLTTQSEVHALLSKPELLAIAEILYSENSQTFDSILNEYSKSFSSEITPRQLYYNLNILIKNNIISTEGENGKKIYTLNKIEKTTYAFSYTTSILLLLSIFNLLFSFSTLNIIVVLLFTIALVSTHFEYSYRFLKNNKFQLLIEKLSK